MVGQGRHLPTLRPGSSIDTRPSVGTSPLRDRRELVEAHEGRGAYMQDVVDSDVVPHYFSTGPELTRPFRGLAVWLPLHLHGVARFPAELDRMLDLAGWASDETNRFPVSNWQRPPSCRSSPSVRPQATTTPDGSSTVSMPLGSFTSRARRSPIGSRSALLC